MRLDYSSILTKVREQVSLLAKRTKTRDGQDMYGSVSVSGVEGESLKSYIDIAMDDALSEFSELVGGVTKDNTGITFTLDNLRGMKMKPSSSSFMQSFITSLEGYVTGRVLYEYFSLTHPALSQKYMNDCTLRMQSLKSLVFFKGEPNVSAISYDDVSGTVSRG